MKLTDIVGVGMPPTAVSVPGLAEVRLQSVIAMSTLMQRFYVPHDYVVRYTATAYQGHAMKRLPFRILIQYRANPEYCRRHDAAEDGAELQTPEIEYLCGPDEEYFPSHAWPCDHAVLQFSRDGSEAWLYNPYVSTRRGPFCKLPWNTAFSKGTFYALRDLGQLGHLVADRMKCVVKKKGGILANVAFGSGLRTVDGRALLSSSLDMRVYGYCGSAPLVGVCHIGEVSAGSLLASFKDAATLLG